MITRQITHTHTHATLHSVFKIAMAYIGQGRRRRLALMGMAVLLRQRARERKMYARPWILKRKQLGAFDALLPELRNAVGTA